MKNSAMVKKCVICAALWIGNANPLWAAATGREDNSDLFVWIFFGFCALIVVAQLIPAMMLLMGFTKGARRRVKEAVPVPTRIDQA